MAANYVQRGDIIKMTAQGTVTSGVPVALHSMIGVPETDGEDGDLVAFRIKGVVQLPLKAGGSDADLRTGKPVSFNETDGVASGAVSAVAGDINNAGVVTDDNALAADAFIEVLLTPGAGEEVA